jgi:hypothetical protein
VHRKDYGWSVGLVYNPREMSGVTTTRPVVAGCYNRVRREVCQVDMGHMPSSVKEF